MVKNTLDKPKLYRPSEIATLGLIKTMQGSDKYTTNYLYILRLINEGRLKAKNYGSKSRAYWLVSEAEIKRYQAEVNK